MNAYITYDRYERDEWYSIYNIETNRQRAIKHFREVDLPDFLAYGPDDCHSFQLQRVEMTKKQYDTFMKWIEEGQSLENYGTKSSELFEFMVDLFDGTGVAGDTSVLFSTDGCSDNFELIEFYCQSIGIEADDDDAIADAERELLNDDELYNKILKEYIAMYY